VYLKVGATEPYTEQVDNPVTAVVQSNNRVDDNKLLYTFQSGETATHSPDPRTLFVVRDSFLNDGARGPANREGGGIQSIAPYFAHSFFAHRRSVGGADARLEPYAKQADLLLFQCVQGELRYFAAHIEEYETLIRWVAEGRRQRPPRGEVVPEVGEGGEGAGLQ